MLDHALCQACHWRNLLCLYCEKYRISYGSKFCVVNWTVVTEAKLIWNFQIVLGFGWCFIQSDRYSLNSDNGCLVLMIDCQVKTTARDWWSGLLLYCIILERKPFKTLFLKRVCHCLCFLLKTAPRRSKDDLRASIINNVWIQTKDFGSGYKSGTGFLVDTTLMILA